MKIDMTRTATVTMSEFQNRNRRRLRMRANRSRRVSCWFIEDSLAEPPEAESCRDVPGNLPFSRGEEPAHGNAAKPDKKPNIRARAGQPINLTARSAHFYRPQRRAGDVLASAHLNRRRPTAD